MELYKKIGKFSRFIIFFTGLDLHKMRKFEVADQARSKRNEKKDKIQYKGIIIFFPLSIDSSLKKVMEI